MVTQSKNQATRAIRVFHARKALLRQFYTSDEELALAHPSPTLWRLLPPPHVRLTSPHCIVADTWEQKGDNNAFYLALSKTWMNHHLDLSALMILRLYGPHPKAWIFLSRQSHPSPSPFLSSWD